MNNKANFTQTFIRVTPDSPPTVEMLEELPLPTGRSFTVERREVRKLDSLTTTNNKGQVANTARATGTDKKHKDDVKSSVSAHGMSTQQQPPYIFEDGEQIDGFTRGEAVTELGFDEWVFNIAVPKPGFTLQDVRDEIGLGANDHLPQKRHSRTDFIQKAKVRIQEYRESHGGVYPTRKWLEGWMDGIPHSFDEKSSKEICQAALDQTDAGETMESTSKKGTVAWAEKNCYKDSKTVFVGLNGGRDKTYIMRAVVENLTAYGQGKMPKTVGYTQHIPANQVHKRRDEVSERIDALNSAFEAAFQQRKKIGPTFRLMDMIGWRGQILGMEEKDELV